MVPVRHRHKSQTQDCLRVRLHTRKSALHTHTRTHTRFMALWTLTRITHWSRYQNQSGFYSSKRQWVAMAYENLQLAPDM